VGPNPQPFQQLFSAGLQKRSTRDPSRVLVIEIGYVEGEWVIKIYFGFKYIGLPTTDLHGFSYW